VSKRSRAFGLSVREVVRMLRDRDCVPAKHGHKSIWVTPGGLKVFFDSDKPARSVTQSQIRRVNQVLEKEDINVIRVRAIPGCKKVTALSPVPRPHRYYRDIFKDRVRAMWAKRAIAETS
jgi:hypothetical protein